MAKLEGKAGPRPSAPRTTRQPKMVEGHSVHRDRFLRHAEEMLDKRDRLQASEKIWGAAAHAVKQVARRRRWPCSSHEDLRDIARYLSDKGSYMSWPGEIHALFTSAESYHVNFYADARSVADIRAGLRNAERLVSLLTQLDETLPLSLAPPRGRDYKGYEKRHQRALARAS